MGKFLLALPFVLSVLALSTLVALTAAEGTAQAQSGTGNTGLLTGNNISNPISVAPAFSPCAVDPSRPGC